eukprot:364197-Chlamydomonas_euryale.AAC.52
MACISDPGLHDICCKLMARRFTANSCGTCPACVAGSGCRFGIPSGAHTITAAMPPGFGRPRLISCHNRPQLPQVPRQPPPCRRPWGVGMCGRQLDRPSAQRSADSCVQRPDAVATAFAPGPAGPGSNQRTCRLTQCSDAELVQAWQHAARQQLAAARVHMHVWLRGRAPAARPPAAVLTARQDVAARIGALAAAASVDGQLQQQPRQRPRRQHVGAASRQQRGDA